MTSRRPRAPNSLSHRFSRLSRARRRSSASSGSRPSLLALRGSSQPPQRRRRTPTPPTTARPQPSASAPSRPSLPRVPRVNEEVASDVNNHSNSHLHKVDFSMRLLSRVTEELVDACNKSPASQGLDLSLASNVLTRFPTSLTRRVVPPLVHLDLSWNRLAVLPSDLSALSGSLQQLDLSFNQLKTLPDSISHLVSLRRLVLNDNEIIALPAALGNCRQLAELSLQYNQVQVLPTELAHLPLTRLNVSGNPLRSPSADVCMQGVQAVQAFLRDRQDAQVLPAPRRRLRVEAVEEVDEVDEVQRVSPTPAPAVPLAERLSRGRAVNRTSRRRAGAARPPSSHVTEPLSEHEAAMVAQLLHDSGHGHLAAALHRPPTASRAAGRDEEVDAEVVAELLAYSPSSSRRRSGTDTRSNRPRRRQASSLFRSPSRRCARRSPTMPKAVPLQLPALSPSSGTAIPPHLLCPITYEIMSDPVLLAGDGHTYERQAIETWLQQKRTSPMTNQRLESCSLIPNHAIRSMISAFVEEHKGGTEE